MRRPARTSICAVCDYSTISAGLYTIFLIFYWRIPSDFETEGVLTMSVYDEKVKDLLVRMTVEEKVGQFQQCGPSLAMPYAAEHIPAMNYVVEPGEFHIFVGGNSRDGLSAQFTL